MIELQLFRLTHTVGSKEAAMETNWSERYYVLFFFSWQLRLLLVSTIKTLAAKKSLYQTTFSAGLNTDKSGTFKVFHPPNRYTLTMKKPYKRIPVALPPKLSRNLWKRLKNIKSQMLIFFVLFLFI